LARRKKKETRGKKVIAKFVCPGFWGQQSESKGNNPRQTPCWGACAVQKTKKKKEGEVTEAFWNPRNLNGQTRGGSKKGLAFWKQKDTEKRKN